MYIPIAFLQVVHQIFISETNEGKRFISGRQLYCISHDAAVRAWYNKYKSAPNQYVTSSLKTYLMEGKKEQVLIRHRTNIPERHT